MVESIARNQNNVVLAASLNRLQNPVGFTRVGQTTQTIIPGFNLQNSEFLFQPLANVIDQQNVLLETRIASNFDNRRERVDARTVQNRLRNRDIPENPFLANRAERELAALRARFGISSSEPLTPFVSSFDRPELSETFSAETTGLTVDGSLTQILENRIAVAANSSLDFNNIIAGSSPTVPQTVLVRLDNGIRSGEDNTLGPAGGRLLLNGNELAGGVAHELSLADFQSLQYAAGEFDNLDYLSVVGLDRTSGTRSDIVTTALSTSSTGVERFIRDGVERYEFIANTEANAPIPRATIDFTGTFVNGSALADINAGILTVSVNQFGDLNNVGTNLTEQSAGNTLDVSFGSRSALDGVVVNIRALDDTIDISDIRVTFG